MSRGTRKMPVSVSFGSFETNRIEFLVPSFEGGTEDGFVGLNSGAIFPFGAVSFVGKEVTSGDLLKKADRAGLRSCGKKESVDMIESYLSKLQEFKIGNVVKIEYLPDGDFNLVKVAERPPRKKASRLP